MNKFITVGIVIVLAIVAGYFLFHSGPTINNEVNNVGEKLNPVADQNAASTTQPITNNQNKQMQTATLVTSMGTIKIEFFTNDAPKTVANFIKLANSKFYDGVKFHRVIKGFMIQGGDPNSKDDSKVDLWGRGGPGYAFPDEINAQSDLYTKVGYQKGIVAMANSGPNTNGSQFFIMHENYPLPPLYTIFGKVVAGQDVVDKIATVKTGPNDRPVTAVVIKSVTIQ